MGVIVGREHEQRRLLSLLVQARTEASCAIVLEGEPGIGKSTLLDWLSRQADNCTVLRARGHEADTSTGYLMLRQMLKPIVHHAEALDTHLRDALHAALSLSDAPVNDGLVPLAVLELVSTASSAQPVLLMMDDFHLYDEASQNALSFVARRMVSERALTVFSIRSYELKNESIFASIERMQLVGLDAGAGRALVEATGRAFSDELFQLCHGNPLALEHLSKQPITADGPLLPERMRQGFERTVRRYPVDTQTALALVAVAGSVNESVLETALGALGVGPNDLRMPERDGLLSAIYEFRHPLMRAAARPDPSHEQRIHDALAMAYPAASASHILHRLKGTGPYPSDLIAAAADHAEALHAAGRNTDAHALFVGAAENEPDPEHRSEFYRRAAQVDAFAGRYGPALQWFERAIASTTNPATQVRSIRSLVWCEMWTTSSATKAAAKLHRALHNVDPATVSIDDLGRAWGSLIALYVVSDVFAATAAIHECPVNLDAYLDSDTTTTLTIANDPAAMPYRNRTVSKFDSDTPINHAEFDISAAAYCEMQLLEGHWTTGDRAASRYLTEIRRAHLNAEFGPAIGRSVIARTFLGDAMTAYGLTLTALEREPDDGSVLGTSALVGAVVGADKARLWATRTRDRGIELELTAFTIDGTHRLGLIELAADNLDGAVEYLTETWRLMTNHGYRHPGYAFARGDIAEVLARTGRNREARQVIQELETSPFDLPWARGVAARARGILGESGQFQKALLLLEESPWEMARTQLCWARTASDPARAGQALAAFETMGARPWAALARALSEGSQAKAVEELVHPLDALSERERTVALAVARGLSNKDVGGELFISLKTVDAHLQQIYRKLEIRSRTQLSALCYAVS